VVVSDNNPASDPAFAPQVTMPEEPIVGPAANPAQAGLLNRPVAIPKFDGTPPTEQSAKNWISGTTLYWENGLNNINKAKLDGYLAFALKDEALQWFITEARHNETLTDSWTNFLDQFKARFMGITLSRVVLNADKATLKQRPTESILSFRSRCLAVAWDTTRKFAPEENETAAQLRSRRRFQQEAVDDNAMWFFIDGLLPVIKKALMAKDFEDLDSCMKQARRVVKLLIENGLYTDPDAAPRARMLLTPNKHLDSNLETVSTVKAMVQAELAAIRKQKPKTSAKAIKDKPRRRYDDSYYTEGATCSFCHKKNHTILQCKSKSNTSTVNVSSTAPDAALNALDVHDHFHALDTTGDFWN